jgi:hypothetical protein
MRSPQREVFMRSIAVAAAATALLVLAMPMSALAAKAPGPPQLDHVFLDSLTYGGNGCPQDTVAQSISNDRESFTLIFDSNVATVGPNVDPHEARKSCQMNFNLHVPDGAPNTVFRLRYLGTMQLPQGATAHRGANYFVGGLLVKTAGDDFSGPSSADWQAKDATPLHLNSLELQVCNAALPVNVQATLQVTAPAGQSAQMTLDSIEGTIQQTGEGIAC